MCIGKNTPPPALSKNQREVSCMLQKAVIPAIGLAHLMVVSFTEVPEMMEERRVKRASLELMG